MSDRLENLLGALVLAVSDSLTSAVQTAAGHPGAMAAGLAVLAQEPGLGIEQLRRQLARTQSATVRVVDQLVAEGQAAVLEMVLAAVAADRAHAEHICRLCDVGAC